MFKKIIRLKRLEVRFLTEVFFYNKFLIIFLGENILLFRFLLASFIIELTFNLLTDYYSLSNLELCFKTEKFIRRAVL